MIESITIKNVATYDFNGVTFNNLKKVNFIYGANGSGKTTISNLIQNPIDEKYQACSISFNNKNPLKTLVYNKEFRQQNFGKGAIKGVFTLGQATKEEIEDINKKTEELKTIKQEISKQKETLSKQKTSKSDLEDAFKEDCWKNVKHEYEEIFKQAFMGY